ncbi:MAG: sulfite exporter TauE/SafE family protein [Defluviitaleaceae bacterium]|nr:sulfite exporter TauE/SafE family protein [Defluviitaleaceae bacterium]
MDWLWLILLGVMAGTLGGMGIGGGAILIPALTMVFGASQHAAQNINLLYFIPTAAFAVFIHAKGGRIETKVLPPLIVGGIVGAVAGSLIALRLEANVLKYIFAGFLFIMGIVEFFKKSEKSA